MAKASTKETTTTTEVTRANLEYVKQAWVHRAIVWPGVTGSETTLTKEKLKGATMWLVPQGLMIKNEKGRALIPNANIVNVIFE